MQPRSKRCKSHVLAQEAYQPLALLSQDTIHSMTDMKAK